MAVLTILLCGIIIGVIISYLFSLFRTRTAQELADALIRESQSQISLSKEKLESEKNLHIKELDSKKELIDRELQELRKVIHEFEKDRIEKYDALSNKLGATSEQIRASSEQMAQLSQTTNSLREALASTKARGQWGERMAEDVLRLAGFIENVNYLKQKSFASGSIPDFTFLLPKNLKLNMDVKFPLDNYLRYLDAEAEAEKKRFCDAFLKDVKSRIKEVTNREYINTSENTVDYVLLFIPNEQIYAFIHEKDQAILDESIKNHVIICSPLTLFAVLAVIRQAVDNFALEKTSNEIILLLGTFKRQWDLFIDKLETLGNHISIVQKDYDTLITTRRRQLEKPLNKIEDLKKEYGLAASTETNDQDALSETEKLSSSS